MHAAAFGDHPIQHYGHWIKDNHPEHLHSYAALLGAQPGGDTGAPETKNNPIPRELYDQVREVTAKTHAMNELIDDACGRIIGYLDGRGWGENTDIFFTTDHGELLGDFGLFYKGPFHVDALMRLPFIWRPAPDAGVPGGVTVTDPVQQIDLTATICAIAGVDRPDWIQGQPLPTADGSPGFERAVCEWDSQFPGYGMHLRSIYRDGWVCTVYEPSTGGQPNGLEKMLGDAVLTLNGVQYVGTEGELYHLADDPHQWTNLWGDPAHAATRADLVADLHDTLRDLPVRTLAVEAPA